MANIIFSILPETGHINASLKIAKSLKSRGHQVYYLQLAEYEEYIRAQGLEFIPLLEWSIPKGYKFDHRFSTMENMENCLKAEAAACGALPSDILKKRLSDVRDKLVKCSPYLLVQDVHAPIGRDELEIEAPWVLLNPTITSPDTVGDRAISAAVSNAPVLILCPEEFDYAPPARSPNEYYVEPAIDLERNEPSFSLDHIRRDKPLIYCSFGTQSHWSFGHMPHEVNRRNRKNCLQTIINTMAGDPHRQLILSLGDHLRAEDFGPIPANVLLVNNVPQIEILKRASLMISHGGLNSIKECIFFGVPLIIFALVGDQFKNAEAVEYHQLGLKGDLENVSEGLLRNLIDEVTGNPAFVPKVNRMKEIFRRAESEGRAIKIIESVLARDYQAETAW